MAEAFSPLNRFFPSLKLGALTHDEISNYLKIKLETLNVDIDENVIKHLSYASEGHPFVLVSMSYNLFDCLPDNKNYINEKLYKDNQLKLMYSLDDFFHSLYSPLTPKAKEILFEISRKLEQKAFSFSQAQKWTRIGRNIISPYISEMVRKACLNRLGRGEYEIFHTLFIPYIHRKYNFDNNEMPNQISTIEKEIKSQQKVLSEFLA